MISEPNNKITERDYYKELHSAARNYNTKLWTIPGLFILVVGFTFSELEFDSINSFVTTKNFLLLIGSGIIIFMLFLQSIKDSFSQISIQKKINELKKEFEEEPLYSATDIEITRRIQKLKESTDADGRRVQFSRLREFLTTMPVSQVFFGAVYSALILIAIGIIFIIFEYFKTPK